MQCRVTPPTQKAAWLEDKPSTPCHLYQFNVSRFGILPPIAGLPPGSLRTPRPRERPQVNRGYGADRDRSDGDRRSAGGQRGHEVAAAEPKASEAAEPPQLHPMERRGIDPKAAARQPEDTEAA